MVKADQIVASLPINRHKPHPAAVEKPKRGEAAKDRVGWLLQDLIFGIRTAANSPEVFQFRPNKHPVATVVGQSWKVTIRDPRVGLHARAVWNDWREINR